MAALLHSLFGLTPWQPALISIRRLVADRRLPYKI